MPIQTLTVSRQVVDWAQGSCGAGGGEEPLPFTSMELVDVALLRSKVFIQLVTLKSYMGSPWRRLGPSA